MASRGRYVFVYTSYKAYSLQSSNGTNYLSTAPESSSLQESGTTGFSEDW